MSIFNTSLLNCMKCTNVCLPTKHLLNHEKIYEITTPSLIIKMYMDKLEKCKKKTFNVHEYIENTM